MPDLPRMSQRQEDQIRELRMLSLDVERLALARRAYAGGVTWKEVKGHTYLTRFWTEGGQKKFRYEGKRSAATEKRFAAFVKGRDEAEAALKAASVELDVASRVAKALRIGRIPVSAADILRALAGSKLAEEVVSSDDACLAAYEADTCITLPTFAGDRASVTLIVREDRQDEVAEVIEQAGAKHGLGRSERKGRFPSAGALTVDMLDRRGLERIVLGAALDDAQHDAVTWALDADPLTTIGVGRDGGPVPLRVLDPRAYVLCMLGHSLTAGRSAPSSDVMARIEAVTTLVADRGYGEPFEPGHARTFEQLADVADACWGPVC